MKNFRRDSRFAASLARHRHGDPVFYRRCRSLDANIGALLPVIKMTLEGGSSQSWLAESLVHSESELLATTSALAEIEGELIPSTVPSDDSIQARSALEWRRSQLARDVESVQAGIARKRWMLQLAERYLPRDPFTTICWIMAIVIVSTLVKHLMMLANELLIGHVSTSIVRGLRIRIFQKSLSLDRRSYQGYGTSGLLASITFSAEALSLGLMNFFGAAIREPLRIVACLVGAALVSPRLLILSLILAPLLILVVTYFNRRVRKTARSILSRNAGFHEVILEALSNIVTVQAYTMEEYERKRFEGCTQDMRRISMKMILYTGLSKPFTELIGVAMIAITVCTGAYLILNQATHISFIKISSEPLTISKLLVFFGFLIGASDPLRKLSGVFTSIHTGAIAADSLYPLLDKLESIPIAKEPISIPKPHRHFELRKVSFHYNPKQPVLKEVSLRVPFGRTIAIVGANGSGKSTLIQLLGRFYDPVEGQILLDDIDYRHASVFEIRHRIAMVSQTTELFNRSVLENIRYGSLDSTREEAIDAAKQAHAHDFITHSLSDGYETNVGQGGQLLSGGQRQRIALARAILRKPEILILDESTSQVDMASELQIRASLQEMKGQFTTIIITHREALVALADETYEMCDGQLVPITYPRQGAA